jgi:hypothetical protein
MKPKLTISQLRQEARLFAEIESNHDEPILFGVDDGKTIGTHFEQKFITTLLEKYEVARSSSAYGIDLPELEVDIKVTSVNKPQSSCPFRTVRQKIFGLGYSLLIFVYSKSDNQAKQTARLNFNDVVFLSREKTADFQMTRTINQILQNEPNVDDLIGLMRDRNLMIDDIEAFEIANELMEKKIIEEGYLTISNAYQWRLSFTRVINKAGEIEGIWRVK